MRNFYIATIAAATFGAALADINDTVAEALRQIQQGIIEAKLENENIKG